MELKLKELILIVALLGCNKNIEELTYKSKIGNDYWKYIIEDNDEELKEFLKKEENKNLDLNTLRNGNGETSLTLSAKHNSLEVVKLLLNKGGIDVDAIN